MTMTELEKATWEYLFNTPSISLLKHGSSYSDFVEAVTSDCKNAFKAGAEWQKNHPTSDYAWRIYNFIMDYKSGKFGEVSLQDAIDKHFKEE